MQFEHLRGIRWIQPHEFLGKRKFHTGVTQKIQPDPSTAADRCGVNCSVWLWPRRADVLRFRLLIRIRSGLARPTRGSFGCAGGLLARFWLNEGQCVRTRLQSALFAGDLGSVQNPSSLKPAMLVKHLQETRRLIAALVESAQVHIHHGVIKTRFKFLVHLCFIAGRRKGINGASRRMNVQ